MGHEIQQKLAIVDQRMKELEAIAKQTNEDLNAVAGQERVAKWKARTATILTQQVGKVEGEAFSKAHAGPSFTNDLVDEFNDEVDYYRAQLNALSKRLQASG